MAGAGIRLQPFKDDQTRIIRQPYIEYDRAWQILLGHGQRLFCRGCDEALEIKFPGKVIYNPCKSFVIFHDQNHTSGTREALTIVWKSHRCFDLGAGLPGFWKLVCGNGR